LLRLRVEEMELLGRNGELHPRVRLDALLSGDPEGKNPLYYWSQVQGMPINLVEPLSPRPYFFAPVVDEPRLLRFRLIVRDEEGAESFPTYVNVTVAP